MVLLALTGAALVQLDDMSQAGKFRVRKTALAVAQSLYTQQKNRKVKSV